MARTSDKRGYVNFIFGVLIAAWALAGPASATADPPPPDVVFILLDCTRADRFSAWGNPNRTTPQLDSLGAEGVAFLRHFANANATRSSFPQLMTGRYYHQNILRLFEADEHPREFPFSASDPTAVLLPAVLRARGYHTVAVSAHPWVVPDSELGRQFEAFDVLSPEGDRAYADAPTVVDLGIARWRARDRGRPAFLYLHFMDMHMPRYLPEDDPRFPVEGFRWRRRFDTRSAPLFEPERREWLHLEARDFTDLDRQHYTAVYDTKLAYTDEHVGRLLAAIRAEDPELRRTVVVVVADHGEELGEEGRTSHSGSLADTVQHIPWIVAGANVQRGQRATRFTEQIDLAPTVLDLLGIPLPEGAHMDGRAQLTRQGAVCTTYGKPAVYYAWEMYRAIRTERYLLAQNPPGSFHALCQGRELLYAVTDGGRTPLDIAGHHQRVAARLRAKVERRLGARERAFARRRFGRPEAPFLVRQDFWELGPDARVACAAMNGFTRRADVRPRGWLWSSRGVTVLRSDGNRPLPVTLHVPDGEYAVDLASVPVSPMPWFFGFDEWLHANFVSEKPAAHLALGTFQAAAGVLSVTIPSALGMGHHIVGLRLSPVDATPKAPASPTTPEDAELHRRLKALGYVQ